MIEKADEKTDPKDEKKLDQKPDQKPETTPADDSVNLQARFDALEAKLAKYESAESDKKEDAKDENRDSVDPRFASINEFNAVDKSGKPPTHVAMAEAA